MNLLELGSSAGLNLLPDRYAHRLGGRTFGDQAAAVQLQPAWTGEAPPPATPQIAERRGVDLNPLDVTSAADRERLLGFVWADQTDRLERTAAAIRVALRDPPRIDAGDAADWLATRLAGPDADDVTTVVLHTIAFQYFPAESQARIVETLREAGRRATVRAALAWLRFELPPGQGQAELRLTLWPGGGERLLARADPHGAAIHWLAGAAG